jgi:hypothetical protein
MLCIMRCITLQSHILIVALMVLRCELLLVRKEALCQVFRFSVISMVYGSVVAYLNMLSCEMNDFVVLPTCSLNSWDELCCLV